MPDPTDRPSLRTFDPYTDRNGQDFGQEDALDVARPAQLQQALDSDPSWQAEVARIASGRPRLDSIAGGDIDTVEATEAETPRENLRRISDPSLGLADRGASPPGDGPGGGQPAADLAAASAPGDREPGEDLDRRQDQLLDQAVEETFPASDPISPKRITK